MSTDAAVRLRATYEVPKMALTIDEACNALGISWDLWDTYVKREVKIIRLGRRRLVPVVELEKWIAAHAAALLDDD